ncbi:MAG: DUF308 domain-containing protein [Methanospirillaceae archaeon]|nr:DUF308 domain-containing protein [Methanospirillaceae archaeon]
METTNPALPGSALLVLRIIAIIFGFAALVWPYFMTGFLILLFGFFVLITSVGSLIAVFSKELQPGAPRWLVILMAIIGILVGIFAIVDPLVMGVALFLFIGAWALVSGIFDIIYAVSGGISGSTKTLLLISGIIGILFGIMVLVTPAIIGLPILVQVAGIFAIIYGIIGFGYVKEWKCDAADATS